VILRASLLLLAASVEDRHLVGDDLDAVALDVLLIGPAGVVDAAADVTFWPLSTNCATVSPTPLKQVIRCHSVPSMRRLSVSFMILPSWSRWAREVASENWVILVPP
jgi:hypothetical protein